MSPTKSAGVSLALFVITLGSARSSDAAGVALQIGGTPPPSVEVGQLFTFRPTVVAPAGAKLAYSVTGKPSWAAFSAATGSLAGVPLPGNKGTYVNISISVTDGATRAALKTFNIQVQKASEPLGTATISWFAPKTNTNGSAIQGLSGYRVHYGRSATMLDSIITVSSAATGLDLQNLATGTWHFAVSAFTTAGMESTLSAVVSKTIN